jgi:branched-chain amino acid transport system substrate-binding protein
MHQVLRRFFMLMMLALLLAFHGCAPAREVRIGFLASLSGKNAHVGKTAQLALIDRVQEINRRGGIGGYPVRLITSDSRGEVADASAAARRLVRAGVIAIIGPEWSAAAIPVAEIASAERVPVIATTASSEQVTADKAGRAQPYMFRVCFTDTYQGRALADFAYHDLGYRRVAFLTNSNEIYSVGIQRAFDGHFRGLGGTTTAREDYLPNTLDFAPQIKRIARSAPDALVIPSAQYRDVADITRQAAEIDDRLRYLGVDAWAVESLLQVAGPALEGAYLSSGFSPIQPQFAAFNHEFEERHGLLPNTYTYYALDALYALEQAVATAVEVTGSPEGTDTRQAIRNALETLHDAPVFTGVISIDPKTHNPRGQPILILKVSGGTFEVVKTYTPEMTP